MTNYDSMTEAAIPTEQPATAKKSISIPEPLLKAAIRRAAIEHRSLSNYIQSLIAADLRNAEENAGRPEQAA